MQTHPTTVRDLAGNPALEAMELRDCNAADCTPTQDADAFPVDELTEREIDALYVAEMERRDREAREVFSGARCPAGAALPPGTIMRGVFATYPDEMLVRAIDVIDRHRVEHITAAQRLELLDAATTELLRRIDGSQRAAA